MLLKIIGALGTVGAVAALVAYPLPQQAWADDSSPVLVETGGVRCSVSANDVPRGGGPMVVCQLSDGQPFPQAPFSTLKPYPKQNLAVVRGGGQFNWDHGSVAAGQATGLGEGQTLHVNGWTIEALPAFTRYRNDFSGYGMQISPSFVRSI